jgi:fructose-1,6-bisphosphatase
MLCGGIYEYPGDNKNANGKLRSLYECTLLSFIAHKGESHPPLYRILTWCVVNLTPQSTRGHLVPEVPINLGTY